MVHSSTLRWCTTFEASQDTEASQRSLLQALVVRPGRELAGRILD
jgi:hypothetical protein